MCCEGSYAGQVKMRTHENVFVLDSSEVRRHGKVRCTWEQWGVMTFYSGRSGDGS